MKKSISMLTTLFLMLWSVSCIEEKPIVCTTELRSFTLTVHGGVLDDYYTIRENNGDTIRNGFENGSGGNTYWVLDDRVNQILKDKSENFRFQGIINDGVAVDELFMFRGGPCHLEKVFGKKEVDL